MIGSKIDADVVVVADGSSLSADPTRGLLVAGEVMASCAQRIGRRFCFDFD